MRLTRRRLGQVIAGIGAAVVGHSLVRAEPVEPPPHPSRPLSPVRWTGGPAMGLVWHFAVNPDPCPPHRGLVGVTISGLRLDCVCDPDPIPWSETWIVQDADWPRLRSRLYDMLSHVTPMPLSLPSYAVRAL